MQKGSPIKNTAYKKIEISFKEWLQTLGYSESTVYGMPRLLAEFLLWLEEKEITELTKIKASHAMSFIEYFKNRPNKRRKGGLSIAHINKQIEVINKLSHYLAITNQANLNIKLAYLKDQEIHQRIVLTKTEIQQLYNATDNSLIGIRDRAMLAVYYGCGLRKAEGIALETTDILFERKLLYVRKPKNGHERYVPINLKSLQDLETYIYHARPLLLDDVSPTEALFINKKGNPIHGQSLVIRVKALTKITTINKIFGLHALRHSIATHLLQAGMELENIALFLGHKTLDSTQLYTHSIMEI